MPTADTTAPTIRVRRTTEGAEVTLICLDDMDVRTLWKAIRMMTKRHRREFGRHCVSRSRLQVKMGEPLDAGMPSQTQRPPHKARHRGARTDAVHERSDRCRRRSGLSTGCQRPCSALTRITPGASAKVCGGLGWGRCTVIACSSLGSDGNNTWPCVRAALNEPPAPRADATPDD